MATEREIHRDDAACTCSIEDASECYYHGRVALKAKVEAAEREAATLRSALEAIAKASQSDSLTASWMRDIARAALAGAEGFEQR